MVAQAHSERAHARFAPSSMERILACPASIRLSEDEPDSGDSFFTREGTACHELAEYCVRENIDPWTMVDMFIDLRAESVETKFLDDAEADEWDVWKIDEEMADGAAMYRDTINAIVADNPDAELELEQRVDLRHINPDCWGTGDAVIYSPSLQRLWVCDLKYGKAKAVEADENPQLLTYAVGSAHRYHNRGVNEIEIVIVQPRAAIRGEFVRRYTLHWDELDAFAARIAEAMAAAEDPNSEPVPGDHCLYCKAKLRCPAHLKMIEDLIYPLEGGLLEETMELADPMALTTEQIALLLANADKLNGFVRAVQKRAHDEAMAGKTIPGFKLVEKRGRRVWIDEEAARAALDAEGVDEDTYMVTKMATPPAVEKRLGKRRQKAIDGLWEKRSSGYTLAPLDDPRPSYNREGSFGAVVDE